MRKILPACLCLCALCTMLRAQTPVVPGTPDEERPTQTYQSVNFGARVGFTSSLFLISRFCVNGVSVGEVQNNYKIGYFASLFMRINFGNHFLQPEASYNINRCDITFDKPLPDNTPANPVPPQASITSSIHSIDVPIIYGYNIIKEGPYSLAIFGGPKLRYIWDKKSDIRFNNFDQENIREKLRPLNLSFTIGTSVTISRVFFDFRYDVGLHNISKRVSYDLPAGNAATDEATPNEAAPDKIRFHRRDNVLSFSFGVFF